MKRILFTFYLISSLISFAIGQSAIEIVKKSDELMRGKQTYGEISMTVVNPNWTRTIKMKVWSLEPDYAMVYVADPPRDKGTVTLKKKNEVWNWLPSIQRVMKIPPSMMLQSWMGSDFTNDDLVKQSSLIDDYEHRLIGEEKIQDTLCWKIEAIPKSDAAVVWGKLILWIAKPGYQQLRIEFYDEDEKLKRTFIGSNLKKFDGRLIPATWEMIPADEKGKKTILEYNNLSFSVSLSSSFFTEKNMKTIR